MNLPVDFSRMMTALLGADDFESFKESLAQESPASIRLNPSKWRKWLRSGKPLPSVVPWCTSGVYLPERLNYTFDPLFHAGLYYVQEASSMFLEQALAQCLPSDKPVLMLDLCAAPGGKSTLALDCLPEGSMLVANEVIRSRSQVLVENLQKWGSPSFIATNSDSSCFSDLQECFDVILADVPCSGEGMFRKDPQSIAEWSIDAVEACWQRQRRIVGNVWPALKSGGLFIYCTCTYNIKENEENVSWICRELGATQMCLDIPEEWKISGSLGMDKSMPVCRFFPHRTCGEGFFLCVLRKDGESSQSVGGSPMRGGTYDRGRSLKQKRKITPQAAAVRTVSSWLGPIGEDKVIIDDGASSLFLFPKRWSEELDVFRKRLRVLQAGTSLGTVYGKDVVPMHALAMGTYVDKSAFPMEDLSLEQAVSYLHKGTVSLSGQHPRGFVLVTYRGVPLGFVKNIGNRVNNLYPQEWRIRTTYQPERFQVLDV